MTAPLWWPAGSATGQGELPGQNFTEALRSVAGELPDLPFVPALTDRGVGADPVGRTLALLVDICGEVVPSGWRITAHPGVDQRRANDLRQWDLDTTAEVLAGAPRMKVHLLGPWSLAARLELPSGNLAIGDHGAVADLAGSLAEGLSRHLAELEQRIPGIAIGVQLDEPDLDRVLAGSIPTASGFGTLRHVPEESVRTSMRGFVESLGNRPVIAGGLPVGPLWKVAQDAGFGAVTGSHADLTTTTAAVLDVLGETISAGTRLLIDVPSARHRTTTVIGQELVAGWRQIGFPAADLAATVTVMAPDLRGVSSADVARELKAAAEIGRSLVDPPESWH